MGGKYSQERYCCSECSRRKVCHVCGTETLSACADCQIDLGATVYVCGLIACRDAHDKKCGAELRKEIATLRSAAKQKGDSK